MRTRHDGRNLASGRNSVKELRSHAEAVGRDVQHLASAAGNVARDQLDPLAEYIQAKPVKSLLIAAGIGAVLGIVLGRR